MLLNGTVGSAQTVLADSENVLSNPGFELGSDNGFPVSWSGRGAQPQWVRLTDEVVFSGNWSVGLFTPGDRTSGWGIQSEPIAVVPGRSYQASVMVKLFGVRTQIYIEFYDQKNSRIRPFVKETRTNNEWTVLSVVGEAPEGSVYARVLLYMPPNVPNTYAYFDDVFFGEVQEEREVILLPEENRAPGTFYVSPNGDDRNPGTFDAPWASLAYASARAIPGDTILFFPGEYTGILKPVRSGTREAPIVFKSLERRKARLVGERGNAPAVHLSGVEHVHIEGFHIRPQSDQGRWLLIDHSRHIRIDDVLMEEARGDIPFTITESEQIQVRDSVMRKFTGPSHNMVRVGNSNYLLFEGNAISRAGHSPFQFYPDSSSRYVVIRGNVFHAAWGRNFEFFGTRDILFEHNIVTNALDSGRSTSSNAKFATDHGIFRFNRVFRNWGGPLHLYPFRDVWIQNTRIYNNIFDDNVDYGIAVSGDSQMRNVLFTNNIFSRNDRDGVGRQISVAIRDPEVVRFTRNVIAADHVSGVGSIESGGVPVPLEVLQGGGGSISVRGLNRGQFIDNLDVIPEFVDADNYNYALKETSPLRSAGYPLTRARGAGEGSVIRVEDATFFYDGFGIEGEIGDWIAIGTADQLARIVQIDYDTNTMILDRNLRWADGAPVSLPWSGEAPDIGVYEHGRTGRPTVHVIVEPFLARPGEEVRLSVNVLGMTDEIAEIRWQLGDGTLAFGSELIHRYEEPYDYPIRVRVTTKSGDVLRGTGYVVVERPREVHEPLLHSTFDRDDEAWWWYWKPYTPTPVDYARELDHITGNGVLRLTNPGGGVIPLRAAPPQWDIDRYPWIYLRYRVSKGAPIGLFVDAFQGAGSASSRVWLAASPKGRLNSSGRSARYELIDDGDWHTLLIDARTVRTQRPDASALRRLGLWALGASERGDTYWIDEVAILPEEALTLPQWREKLKHQQRGHPRIVSPRDGAVVSGEMTLDLAYEDYIAPVCPVPSRCPSEILVPIEQVVVAVDGQVVWSGDDLEEARGIRIETTSLSDGPHNVTVIVTDNEGYTAQQTITIDVRNRRLMIDRLEPPEVWTFFGEPMITDRSMTIDESDGWIYAAHLDDPRFQRLNGKVKSSDGDVYLVWEAPDLRSFMIIMYAAADTVEDDVKAMMRTSETDWIDLPLTVQKAETAGDEVHRWNKFAVTGEAPRGLESVLFKLHVGSGVPAYQLGIEEVVLDIRSF